MLDLLHDGEMYIVGSGDKLHIKSIDLSGKGRIIGLRYKLEGVNVEDSKNGRCGMPYSHNALMIRKCELRYRVRYSVSADYDYMMRYLNKWQIKRLKISRGGGVIIDEYGFSVKKERCAYGKIYKLYEHFGVYDCLRYILEGVLFEVIGKKGGWKRGGLKL